MMHQNSNKKLNCSSKHRKALIRNQAIHFIKYGKLITTSARVKAVRSFVEKIVTLARKGGDFNTIRQVKSILPYDDEAVAKLFKDIAPKYINRPGGYTRIYRLGQRMKDTASTSLLNWV